jgi:S-formylglutathione hydrolase FrmB
VSALTVLEEQSTAAGVLELRLHSPALGRDAPVTVLTPDGWRPGDHGSHPVLYLFHGSSDDHLSWTRNTEIARLAAESNVLVAIPSAGRMGFYTDWEMPDREGTVPHWEQFHTVELMSLLEREYGASDSRMAAGLSMGGYGALRYAIRHPGLFRGVASLSGFVHLTKPGAATLLGLLALREGMRPGRIWGPKRRCPENWAANDPYLQAAGLAGTKVYLAAGDGRRTPGEEFVAGMGLMERYFRASSEKLAERLRAEGVEVTTNFSPGIHFWTTWRRTLTEFWPYALGVLNEERC